MIFNRFNCADIKKYFQDSYMKFPSMGDEVFYVHSVSDKGLKGACQDKGEGAEWIYSFDKGDTEIDFIFPKKSYFIHENCAYFLHRIPAKQYSRGINNSNTAILKLVCEEFVSCDVDLTLLNAYTSKPLFKGFDMASSGQSYAVSSRIAVCATGKIYVDKIRVGSVVKEKGLVCINQEVFLPEIEALLKEHCSEGVTMVYHKTTQRTAKPRKTLPTFLEPLGTPLVILAAPNSDAWFTITDAMQSAAPPPSFSTYEETINVNCT